MNYLISISPVLRNQSAIVKYLEEVLGPDRAGKVRALVKSGGVVLQNLNQNAAEKVANQLRSLGAQTEIIPMEEQGPEEFFRVNLLEVGENEIEVIKEIRDITGSGLKEAKEMVDNLGVVEEDLSLTAAKKLSKKMEAVGAKVRIEKMNFADPDSREKPSFRFDKDKREYSIETPGGHKALLNDETGAISVQDIHGNKIVMNEDGISIESIKDVNIKAMGEFRIKG